MTNMASDEIEALGLADGWAEGVQGVPIRLRPPGELPQFSKEKLNLYNSSYVEGHGRGLQYREDLQQRDPELDEREFGREG